MSAFNQTVTVYRRRGGQVSRSVYEGCVYQWRIAQRQDEWGNRQDTLFLLVLPGEVPLEPGDRVFDGIGPEVIADEWVRFIPVNVPGLGQIGYVRPCRLGRRVCYTEAGRK